MVVSVVNDVEQLAALRQEGPHLTIVPTGDDRLSILHEIDGIALKSRHLDSQKLLSGGRVPHSDVVDRACGEDKRVAVRESDVVDLLVVTSVTQLRVDGVSVTPVDCCFVASDERVCAISSQRE